jgi:glutamate dehydrogenase (NAD(P)+)
MLETIDLWGPEKIVCVSDVKTGMRGVLVIDNTARGPGKGGTRMATDVTVQEVARIARNMTWKWAVVDLFQGGAKAGILADPNNPNKEAILRSFVRALHNEVPQEHILGLDVGMTAEDAAIIVDEARSRGAVVGTPAALGGLPVNPLGVTGFGVGEAADEAARYRGVSIASSRVSIQGFGAVGVAAAKRLGELGATVVAISTARGVLHDPSGLNVEDLLRARTEYGDALVEQYPREMRIPLGAELIVDAEVLIPAATQDVIDESVAAEIRAQIVVEGANLPTTSAAQQVLAERGITVVPDFVANAGGIVAGAVALDERHSAIRPDPGPVFAMVTSKIRSATADALEQAHADGSTTHDAALGVARSRVHEAMQLLGRVPRY